MIITATTPEETRQAIVKYISEQASHYRRQGMITRAKNLSRARLVLAEQLEFFVKTLSVAPINKPGDAYLAGKNDE